MKLKLLFIVLMASVVGWGQINYSNGTAVTQNFNSLGSSSTATLPSNWKVSKSSTQLDTPSSYASALTAVERSGGNAMSNSASNGIYRFNANSITTESAIGGLASSSASKSVFVYTYLKNTDAATSKFDISYDVEKYRKGSNPNGFSMQLFYSLNGTSWTSCGTSFYTNFSADADSDGYALAPGVTIPVSATFTLPGSTTIATDEVIYFAWRYSANNSSSGNAQAFGIDNVSITGQSACTPPTPTFTASPTNNSEVCKNTDITYTTEAGMSSYVWSVPGTLNTDYTITSGGTGSSSNTVTLRWLTSGSKNVTVGYTSAGCASTTPASNTVTVIGNSIAPTSTQNILTNTNGTALNVTDDGTATAHEWKYATSTGGTLLSFSPAQTGTSYTPNFATAGNYFVVCESTTSCGTIKSNEVQISVTNPPTVVLSSNNPASSALTLVQNTTNNVIYGFQLDVTVSNATLSQVVFNTTGSYANTDVTNFKLWYSADNTFSSASDTQIGSSITTGLGTGSHTFASLSRTISAGTSGYFFITTDVPCAATNGNIIRVSAITTSNLTFSGTVNLSGSTSLGSNHTFQSSTPVNVSSPTTETCQNGQTRVRWVNPTSTTCFDEVYVFAKAGAFTSAVPTGDGSAYGTANTTFTGATTFDGAQLVYKGTLLTVLVSGLTNNTNYTYKIFTRNDLNWSSGVTVNCTPTAVYCSPSPIPNSGYEYISNVTFGSEINNSTTGTQYNYYPTPIANLQIGIATPLSVTISNSYTSDRVFAFIDWNQDGDWEDTNESIALTYSPASGTFTATTSVTPPAGALTGNTRMRIKLIEGTNSTPCVFATYGEVEDYQVNISPACTPPLDPQGEISGPLTSCTATTLTYTGPDFSNAYWQTTASGTSTTNPANVAQPVSATPGVYTYYVRTYDGTCWSTNSLNHTITVNATPTITSQPADANVTIGGTATFNVTATGNDLNYIWEVSTDCGANWSTAGTSPSLSVSSVTAAMNGYQYRVTITNSCGSIVSNISTLFVVQISNSVDTNFSTVEGWVAIGSYSDWNRTIEGITWDAKNIRLNTNGDGLQFNYQNGNSLVDISSVDYPVTVEFRGGLKGSPGSTENNKVFLQYWDTNTSNWINLAEVDYNDYGNSYHTETVNVGSITSLQDVVFRLFRDNSSGSLRAFYITSFKVSSKNANDYTWTGNANTTSWDDSCNWDPIGIPSEIDNVRFRFETDSTNTLNIIDNRTVNNLILDEQGVFDVASTGNFTVNGNITYLDTNGATANFDCQSSFNIASTSIQTIPSLNYGNLNAVGGDRNLVSNKTVGVCNTFTPGVGTYTMNQSTFNYNGNNDQIVNNSIEYYNLLITGSGVKTTAHGDVIVNGMTSIKSADAVLRVPRPGNIPDATPIPPDTTPNVFYALGGIDNTNGTTGKFVLSSDANLIQHNDSRNNADNSKASIVVERYVHDMDANNPVTTPVLWDYVYWSSPIKNHALRPFSPGTQTNRFYEYRESNNLFYNAPEDVFYDAKGYAIRAEGDLGSTYNKTYEFTGEPNNANSYVSPFLKMENNGYNLVGNPYPSNIDLDALFSTNSSNIYSVAYFWTNNTPTYYQSGASYVSNSYAIYNGTGGVPATTNATGGTTDYNVTAIPNGYAKVGQGFIVKAKTHNVARLTFNTNMRAADNDMFFHRQVKNRFWINLSSPSQIVNTILVGYIPGATNEYEQDFDSNLMTVGSDAIYSILGTRKLAIQGKEDNFQVTDVIPIGVKFFELGKYTIDIPTREGLFETQKIYLKDKYRGNSIHDFTNGGYTFKAGPGEFKDRFEIIFKRKNISVSSQASLHTLADGKINIIKENDFISISSSNSLLKKVEIFNLSGRSIYQNQTINQTQLQIPAGIFGKEILIVNVETSEGEIVSKKLINN